MGLEITNTIDNFKYRYFILSERYSTSLLQNYNIISNSEKMRLEKVLKTGTRRYAGISYMLYDSLKNKELITFSSGKKNKSLDVLYINEEEINNEFSKLPLYYKENICHINYRGKAKSIYGINNIWLLLFYETKKANNLRCIVNMNMFTTPTKGFFTSREYKIRSLQVNDKEEKIKNNAFKNWIKDYILDTGFDFVYGAYIITNNKDELIMNSDEYESWMNDKREEFNKVYSKK